MRVRKDVHKSMAAFTRRCFFGQKPLLASKSRSPTISLQAVKCDQMVKATSRVHDVFTVYASSSPRFRALSDADPETAIALQTEVYRRNSTSPTVVSRRARMAESFFEDLAALGMRADSLTPLMVATWAASRTSCNSKTAGAVASSSLKIVQAATDWPMHWEHPLVAAQLKASRFSERWSDLPRPALTPSRELVLRMENLITSATTAQQRCLAGFFTLLAMSTARASDAQSSRGLEVSDYALSGEARTNLGDADANSQNTSCPLSVFFFISATLFICSKPIGVRLRTARDHESQAQFCPIIPSFVKDARLLRTVCLTRFFW